MFSTYLSTGELSFGRLSLAAKLVSVAARTMSWKSKTSSWSSTTLIKNGENLMMRIVQESLFVSVMEHLLRGGFIQSTSKQQVRRQSKVLSSKNWRSVKQGPLHDQLSHGSLLEKFRMPSLGLIWGTLHWHLTAYLVPSPLMVLYHSMEFKCNIVFRKWVCQIK